jgi:hypothetical protein
MNHTDLNNSADAHWNDLYKIGAWAAIAMLVLIPIHIIIFVISPPPATVEEFFALFQKNWLLGLLSLDLIYILNNILLSLIYLALYQALKQTNAALMTAALMLGLLGIAAYFASNPAFEMLSLSRQYAAATNLTQQTILLAAGQSQLASFTGTAFDVYYVLNGVALLLLAWVMLHSPLFSKATAWWGLASGILMTIPSTAGVPGMLFALASLAPWMVFLVMVTRRLWVMGKDISLK